MEVQHHIAPLIGWLRTDAQRGKVDSEGVRLGEWYDRLDRAVDAVMKQIGEVEYEYAAQIQYTLPPYRTEIVNGVWGTEDQAQKILEWRKGWAIGLIDVTLVKRRKAGGIEVV